MIEQVRYPGFRESFASTVLHYPWGAGPSFARWGNIRGLYCSSGGDDNSATPYANVPRVKRVFPRTALTTLRGGRHAPHVERAEEVNGRIVAFLTQVA